MRAGRRSFVFAVALSLWFSNTANGATSVDGVWVAEEKCTATPFGRPPFTKWYEISIKNASFTFTRLGRDGVVWEYRGDLSNAAKLRIFGKPIRNADRDRHVFIYEGRLGSDTTFELNGKLWVTIGSTVTAQFARECVIRFTREKQFRESQLRQAPPARNNASKLDGSWVAEEKCTASSLGPPPFTKWHDITVTNGRFVFTWPGLNGVVWEYRGDLSDPAKLSIVGKPVINPQRVPLMFVYEGRLESDTAFLLTGKMWITIGTNRHINRECTIRFARTKLDVDHQIAQRPEPPPVQHQEGRKLDVDSQSAQRSEPPPVQHQEEGAKIFNAAAPAVVLIVATFTNENKRIRTLKGAGSVIEVNGEPLILTSHHVIDEDTCDLGLVYKPNDNFGRLLPIKFEVIKSDRLRDLALLRPKVRPGRHVQALKITSERVEPGMTAYAIGHPQEIDHPFGTRYEWTITTGIVSQIRDDFFWGTRRATVIQTQAPINHGNSGGPLLNRDGQIIGVIAFGEPTAAGLLPKQEKQTDPSRDEKSTRIEDKFEVHVITPQNLNFAIHAMEIQRFLSGGSPIATRLNMSACE